MLGFAIDGKHERRRTKSVITPESKKRCSEPKFGVGHATSATESPRTWISVKVSPTLESGREASGRWGDRHEFSTAMKTINSKFKGEIPVQQPIVAVDQVNATAQPSQRKKKAQSSLLASASSSVLLSQKGGDSELPSPPSAGRSLPYSSPSLRWPLLIFSCVLRS